MGKYSALPAADFEKLSALDTCTVSNAIERSKVRLRNEGLLPARRRAGFQSRADGWLRGNRADPHGVGTMAQRCYYDRMDWWNFVASIPSRA